MAMMPPDPSVSCSLGLETDWAAMVTVPVLRLCIELEPDTGWISKALPLRASARLGASCTRPGWLESTMT